MRLNCSRFTSRSLLLLNSLSLDAPVVAICWQNLAARVLGVTLFWHEVLLLFLVTWLAYAGDRLLDSVKPTGKKSPLFRHEFAAKHRQKLVALWGVLFLVTISITFLLVDQHAIFLAGYLAAGVTIYFAFCFYYPRIARIVVPRELVVSCVFVLAALFFPVFHLDEKVFSEFRVTIAWLAGILGCLGFLNCLGISCWEQEADQFSGEVTMATTFPTICNFYPVGCIAVACVGAVLIIFEQIPPALFGINLGSAVTVLLFAGIHYSKIPQQYRPVLADLALIIPWCFLFFC